MRIKKLVCCGIVSSILFSICTASGKAFQISEVKAICEDAKDRSGCEKYFQNLAPIKNNDEKKETNIIESLRILGAPSRTDFGRDYIELHFDLLHAFWRNRFVNLPDATLLLDDGFMKGCGKLRISKFPNIYCPDYAEITLNAKPLVGILPDKSNLNINHLNLIILAHEFGHHVNNFSGRPPEEMNEESAADIRSGQYLSYALNQGLIDLEAVLLAAQMFFQIGDFHMNIGFLHENPKKRFDSFISGFNKGSKVGSSYNGWYQDTSETFSRPMASVQGLNGFDGEYVFDVYRFEIERAGQIIGNALSAMAGGAICANGSSQACANTILFGQGKAKPQGWYRKRKLMLSCSTGVFDIEGDGIKAQLVEADQKGQAQALRSRYCDS